VGAVEAAATPEEEGAAVAVELLPVLPLQPVKSVAHMAKARTREKIFFISSSPSFHLLPLFFLLPVEQIGEQKTYTV
jgi:hypothetical protein